MTATHEYIDSFREKTGRSPSYVELSQKLKISQNAAIKGLIEYTQGNRDSEAPVPEKREKDLTIIVLKWALVLLATMAFILSVYFTGLWFLGKFHIIISGLISLTMVLFMVISPQTLRFISHKGVRAVVVISFMIALIFSMGSTVAGQYNKTTENITTDIAFTEAQSDKSELETEGLIEEAQRDKSVHQSTISMLSATEEKRLENWQSIATERKYISAYDERIDELREELTEIRGKQTGISETRDFYLFVSELTGMEKSLVEFLIAAMPSVFIDIISALCLNLALFLGRKR